jgi:preprotein translocase subunit SecG
MLYALIMVLHVIVSTILVLVVLLQTGKRADLAGAFGGGGSQTAFGARGAATAFSKITTGAAVLFMVTSLTLSILSGMEGGGGSALDSTPAPVTQEAPAGEVTPEDPTGGALPVIPSEPTENESDSE